MPDSKLELQMNLTINKIVKMLAKKKYDPFYVFYYNLFIFVKLN